LPALRAALGRNSRPEGGGPLEVPAILAVTRGTADAFCSCDKS
jgi:hypothetical protein